MGVLLGINSSLFMQSIKLHPLKGDIGFIVVKDLFFCTVFSVISFLSMVSVEWMVPLLSVTNSYFQCLYSLRGSSPWPHCTIAKVTELPVTKAPSMHGKTQKRLKNKNQLTNSELQQHLFVKQDRLHSPTLTNPISTCIKNARSVNLQGHLIHHIPWSSSKIFDQEGYSIIFLFLEIHRRKLLFLYRKSEWWQVSGEEEMCDRHTSLL